MHKIRSHFWLSCTNGYHSQASAQGREKVGRRGMAKSFSTTYHIILWHNWCFNVFMIFTFNHFKWVHYHLGMSFISYEWMTSWLLFLDLKAQNKSKKNMLKTLKFYTYLDHEFLVRNSYSLYEVGNAFLLQCTCL